MLSPWSRFPAVRLAIIFIAGIALHILLPYHWQIALSVWSIFGVATFYFALVKKFWLNRSVLFLPGLCTIFLVLATAYLLTFASTQIFYPSHFSKQTFKSKFLVASVEKPPIDKGKSFRAILSINGTIDSLGKQHITNGKLLTTFLKDSHSTKLKYGSVLLIPASYSEIEPPKNPEQFNYKEFMSFQNVYHQTFLNGKDWQLLQGNVGNKFFIKIYQLRDVLFAQISKYVSTKNELGVASALMLGYNDFITPEVTSAYAASGALHVLSVSGLHVGMVYIVLSRLFFFLNKTKRTRLLQTVLIVVLIWIYACLTGLSPSVLRSAAMFSMMAIGKQFSTRPNIFNIIGASALLLMIFNPFIMTEVGFKLSYLAVIGIVYLQPIIVKWFSFKNRIVHAVWEVTAVSIAAQVATFPLGLYYFHQFPNLFLVSNLIVIPAGWLLIHTGILLFMLSPIQSLQWLVGKAFYWLTLGLNKFIFAMEEIPYSILNGISISAIEMFLIYVAVLLCISLMVAVMAEKIKALAVVILLLVVWNGFEFIQQQNQQKIICYSVKGKQALALIEGNTAFIDFDSTLLNNKSAMLFNVQHHWWLLGVQNVKPISKYHNFYQTDFGYAFNTKGKQFLVINKKQKQTPKLKNYITSDVLLLSNSPTKYLKPILSFVEPKTLIADASNKNYLVKNWQKTAAQQKIDFKSVANAGYQEW